MIRELGEETQRSFCRNKKADPTIHMEIHRDSEKPKKLLKENKVKGFTLPSFKTHCKATLIKLCNTG